MSKLSSHANIHNLVLVVGIAEPVMTIPQVYKVWVENQTAGLSIYSWIFYGLGSCVWLVYGLKIKDKPVIVTGILWILMAGAVAIGILAN